jgi:hypothetical protein
MVHYIRQGGERAQLEAVPAVLQEEFNLNLLVHAFERSFVLFVQKGEIMRQGEPIINFCQSVLLYFCPSMAAQVVCRKTFLMNHTLSTIGKIENNRLQKQHELCTKGSKK